MTRESRRGANTRVRIGICLNEECELFNEYFTVCKGYGLYDIVAESNNVKCPKCGKRDKELRNIGVINSKYEYKGCLKQGKESKFSGDASTFENNKLYILNEINFKNEFKALLIEVSFLQICLLLMEKTWHPYFDR